MPIRQLPQSLVNKIAAGEVIERPASLVKELMENAVDAGASRIDVAVEAGGRELVRVVDNGCGIPADELPLAVASHATSKLAEADDLFRIATLGFRGEALASIGAVSRLLLRSRPPESQGGSEVEVTGGNVSEVSPCASAVGTAIEVRNLFFNTPVRRKFLRTNQTEFGHLSEAFTRIALGAPQIHFTLKHGQRTVFELPGGEDWRVRIGRFFGRDLAENLIAIEGVDGEVSLTGYVANPTHSRGNNRMQYLFLGGRHIRDRSLQHALGEAYRGLLMTGRYPITFLRLELPPETVDVNVHPTKLEVRFQDAGRLYSQLLSTLRNKFLTTDLTAQIGAGADDDAPPGGHDPARATQLRQQLVDWAKGKVSGWDTSDAAGGEAAARAAFSGGGASPDERRPLELARLDRGLAWTPPSPRSMATAADDSAAEPAEGAEDGMLSPATLARASALQIHNRYLVAETQQGVTIIDQHALHERILYEHLRARVEAGAIEMQALLVPEPVDLSAAEAAAALEHRELLAELGMKIEPFGGDTVLLAGYPAMLANLNPTEILHELIENMLSGGKTPEPRDLLDSLLHTIACKAAIKAGDRLAPEEIEALLTQSHLVDDPHHCPHGRPTALVFTREELDKRFKRV